MSRILPHFDVSSFVKFDDETFSDFPLNINFYDWNLKKNKSLDEIKFTNDQINVGSGERAEQSTKRCHTQLHPAQILDYSYCKILKLNWL